MQGCNAPSDAASGQKSRGRQADDACSRACTCVLSDKGARWDVMDRKEAKALHRAACKLQAGRLTLQHMHDLAPSEAPCGEDPARCNASCSCVAPRCTPTMSHAAVVTSSYAASILRASALQLQALAAGAQLAPGPLQVAAGRHWQQAERKELTLTSAHSRSLQAARRARRPCFWAPRLPRLVPAAVRRPVPSCSCSSCCCPAGLAACSTGHAD